MSLNYGKKKTKVIFFGDAINEMDDRPGGYISWIIDHLKNEGIEEKYNIVASLKPGQKIYDLYQRLEEHVLIKDAHIVVLYIGVHDVLDRHLIGTGTDIETFESLLQALLNKLYAANIKVIMCTPIAELKQGFPAELKEELAEYTRVITETAEAGNMRIVDLSRVFEHNSAEVDNPYEKPNYNQLVANEIWRVLSDVR